MQQIAKKARLFGGLILRNPQEAIDRMIARAEVVWEARTVQAPAYPVSSFETTIAALEPVLDVPLKPLLEEAALKEVSQHVRDRLEQLAAKTPFTLIHNADLQLASLQYAICRAIKPLVVVETGVAYGVSSAFILRALAENGQGMLYSIDLPPLANDAKRFVGVFVSDALVSRWELRRGTSRRILPEVLSAVKQVDLFVHDSLHTYRNMRYEFRAVMPYLSRGAVLISDDVEDNPAFHDWVIEAEPRFWATMAEHDKAGLFAIGVLKG